MNMFGVLVNMELQKLAEAISPNDESRRMAIFKFQQDMLRKMGNPSIPGFDYRIMNEKLATVVEAPDLQQMAIDSLSNLMRQTNAQKGSMSPLRHMAESGSQKLVMDRLKSGEIQQKLASDWDKRKLKMQKAINPNNVTDLYAREDRRLEAEGDKSLRLGNDISRRREDDEWMKKNYEASKNKSR